MSTCNNAPKFVSTGLLFCGLFATLAGASPQAWSSDALALGVGRVAVVHSKESIATVAVGDPTIADVAMEGETSVMVFGKKPGETDLVLMSAAHRPILSQHILVGTAPGADTIIVRRPEGAGMTDEAWFCAPGCVKLPGGGNAGAK